MSAVLHDDTGTDADSGAASNGHAPAWHKPAAREPASAPVPAPAKATARPAPSPIRFPSRANIEELCRTRANADNERWRKQAEQRGTLIASAHAEGYDQGERAGYLMGWHYGLVAGIAVGGVAVGLLWAAWGPLQGLLASLGVA